MERSVALYGIIIYNRFNEMKHVYLILWFLISVHILKHHTWAGSCAC